MHCNEYYPTNILAVSQSFLEFTSGDLTSYYNLRDVVCLFAYSSRVSGPISAKFGEGARGDPRCALRGLFFQKATEAIKAEGQIFLFSGVPGPIGAKLGGRVRAELRVRIAGPFGVSGEGRRPRERENDRWGGRDVFA